MDNFTLDRITAYIILDTRRAKKDSNKYPVKYRVCFLRKCTYFPSGRNLTKDEFILLDDPSKLKRERILISAGFEKIKEQIIDLVKGQGFSIELLTRRLSRGTKDSIYDAFDNKIAELKATGNIGTADWYKYSKKSLEEFAGENLTFHQVTKLFLQKYEKHLLEKKKSITSVSIKMRALQTIVNEGKRQGIINQSQHPFGKGRYEIPNVKKRNLALKLSQIKQIIEYPLAKRNEKRCRDLWLFCYLANGINMVDLLQLKYKDIRNGKIYFYRQKSTHKKDKKEIVAIVQAKMWEIINEWGNKDKHPNNYIFPILTEDLSPERKRTIVMNTTNLVNKKMRKIGKALGIGNISTYTARHSFATVLKRSGTSVEYISEALGHSDVLITQTYLDSFEDEEIIKNAEKLLKFD